MFPNLYFCLYRDLTFVLLSIMKKRFRKSIHLKTNHAYVIKLSLGKKTGYAQRRSRGLEAVLCTGPFLEEIEIRKVLYMVAVRSSAFVGDVKLVIDGILSVMEERLEEGDVIQLGRLGNFRMVAGSKGVENEADFNTSFFNKARIVFSPGTMLTQVKKNVTFEHLDLVPAGDKPSSGGGEEKPGEL